MNLEIVIPDRVIDSPHKELINDYIKRISPYAKVKLQFGKQARKSKEKSRKESAYKIRIDSECDLISSEELAKKFRNWANHSIGDISFYIGFDELIGEDESFGLISFAPSNQMTVSILVEQIFRAYTIIHGRKYHK